MLFILVFKMRSYNPQWNNNKWTNLKVIEAIDGYFLMLLLIC